MTKTPETWVRKRRTKAGAIRYNANVRWPNGATESATFARRKGEDGADQWITDRLASRAPVTANAKATLAEAWTSRMDRATKLARTTRRDYAYTYARWIGPRLGELRLKDVDDEELEAWVDWAREEGATDATILKAIRYLRPVFTRAHRKGHLPANPVTGLVRDLDVVHKPRVRPALNVEDVLALAHNVHERYRALVYVLGFVGLRIGEAVALTVADLVTDEDAEGNETATLVINKHATPVPADEGGWLVESSTKTGHDREVPIPEVVRAELVAHLERTYGRRWRWQRGALMFPNTRPGTRHTEAVIDPQHLLRSELRPTANALGIHPANAGREFETHWLRHTAARIAIRGGADVTAVQRMLGHSTPTVTLNAYLAWFNARERAGANAVDAAVAKAVARVRDEEAGKQGL
jgi:integrase